MLSSTLCVNHTTSTSKEKNYSQKECYNNRNFYRRVSDSITHWGYSTETNQQKIQQDFNNVALQEPRCLIRKKKIWQIPPDSDINPQSPEVIYYLQPPGCYTLEVVVCMDNVNKAIEAEKAAIGEYAEIASQSNVSTSPASLEVYDRYTIKVCAQADGRNGFTIPARFFLGRTHQSLLLPKIVAANPSFCHFSLPGVPPQARKWFSRRHCCVCWRYEGLRLGEATFTLIDLGSANGTYLNGKVLPPAGSRFLQSGDLIGVSMTESGEPMLAFRFVVHSIASRVRGMDTIPSKRVAEITDYQTDTQQQTSLASSAPETLDNDCNCYDCRLERVSYTSYSPSPLRDYFFAVQRCPPLSDSAPSTTTHSMSHTSWTSESEPRFSQTETSCYREASNAQRNLNATRSSIPIGTNRMLSSLFRRNSITEVSKSYYDCNGLLQASNERSHCTALNRQPFSISHITNSISTSGFHTGTTSSSSNGDASQGDPKNIIDGFNCSSTSSKQDTIEKSGIAFRNIPAHRQEVPLSILISEKDVIEYPQKQNPFILRPKASQYPVGKPNINDNFDIKPYECRNKENRGGLSDTMDYDNVDDLTDNDIENDETMGFGNYGRSIQKRRTICKMNSVNHRRRRSWEMRPSKGSIDSSTITGQRLNNPTVLSSSKDPNRPRSITFRKNRHTVRIQRRSLRYRKVRQHQVGSSASSSSSNQKDLKEIFRMEIHHGFFGRRKRKGVFLTTGEKRKPSFIETVEDGTTARVSYDALNTQLHIRKEPEKSECLNKDLLYSDISTSATLNANNTWKSPIRGDWSTFRPTITSERATWSNFGSVTGERVHLKDSKIQEKVAKLSTSLPDTLSAESVFELNRIGSILKFVPYQSDSSSRLSNRLSLESDCNALVPVTPPLITTPSLSTKLSPSSICMEGHHPCSSYTKEELQNSSSCTPSTLTIKPETPGLEIHNGDGTKVEETTITTGTTHFLHGVVRRLGTHMSRRRGSLPNTVSDLPCN